MDQALPFIAVGCGIFALVLFFGKAFAKLLRLCLRAAIGGVGFFAVNACLGAAGLAFTVGINAVTVLVVGVLGIPGFLLLYAVQIVLR
jgi:inhibitor of the pro-sigma K processing machinery